MSGFFGIFNRNGEAIETKIVHTMLDTVSSWNSDEKDTWINGSVAFGHTMLRNTPESKYEHLPLEKDAYLLTMDARIDNRDELMKELELPDRLTVEIGDSEFILAAYQKWGEECPKHLLGDFAFAIWDETKKQLFCARDHIGIKSFYYYLNDDIFVFSNDIEGLLLHPNIPKDFNNDTLAMYMHDEGVLTKTDTFFKEIKKLPAASTLLINMNSISKDIYWRIEDSPAIEYESYEEYTKKFRELLESAVDVRLRTVYPVASHLSGGLDSSPIAVLAARELKKREEILHVFNWIDIPENEDTYEYEAWSFSRRISKQEENIKHHEFSIGPLYMVDQYEKHNIFTKGTMWYWSENFIQDKVHTLGARTMLSGWGGDEFISNSGYRYIGELFKQKKFVQAFKYLLNEKQTYHYSWKRFVKRFLLEMLPVHLLSGEDNSNMSLYASKWFSELVDSHKKETFSLQRGVKSNIIALYNRGSILERIESWSLSAYDRKLEYRYPLLDKRIIEFTMGIPQELFFPKDGVNRFLVRNAVVDLLPHDILWFLKADEIKVNKTHKNEYKEALKLLKINILEIDCSVYQQNYIDCKKMKETLSSFDFDQSDVYDLGNIITAFMLYQSLAMMKNNC